MLNVEIHICRVQAKALKLIDGDSAETDVISDPMRRNGIAASGEGIEFVLSAQLQHHHISLASQCLQLQHVDKQLHAAAITVSTMTCI